MRIFVHDFSFKWKIKDLTGCLENQLNGFRFVTQSISLLVNILDISIFYIYPNFAVVIFSLSYWIIDLIAYYSYILLYNVNYWVQIPYSEWYGIERLVIWSDKGLTIFLCMSQTKVRKCCALPVQFQEMGCDDIFT
jgi:hypothetical protein